MSDHFLFIESNTTGTGVLAVRRLLERGDRVTFLARSPEKYPVLATPLPRLAVVRQDTNDLPALLRRAEEIHRRERVDAALTFSEFYVPAAAEVAARLGLRQLAPAAARVCRHKPSMREALRAAGLETPGFWVVASAAEAVRVAATITYPAVVKPPADSSSKGVRLVRDAEELLAHFDRLHAQRVNDRGQRLSGEVLIETLLEGPEVSVETVTLAPGETRVIGVTAKHLSPPPLFVETGHDFPAAIPEDLRERLAATVAAALVAVGFDFGPAHTEVRCTTGGLVVVEINPRMAGGMIPELVRHATGIDLLMAFFDQLLGRSIDLVPRRAEIASIRFLLAGRSGYLAGVDGIAQARRLPGVREVFIGKSAGTLVRPAEEAADRLGYVIAGGTDRRQVAAVAGETLRSLRIHIESAVEHPAGARATEHVGGASELFS